MIKSHLRAVALTICCLTALTAFSPATNALDGTETIWGSCPASAYITMELYKGENTVTIPVDKFSDVEGATVEERAKAAYAEAYKQSAYLFTDTDVHITSDGKDVTITRKSYFDTKTEQTMRDSLETTANRIITSIITSGMTDREKANIIYDYVRQNSNYDWTSYDAILSDSCWDNIGIWGKSITAYGCLMEGKSVCQGDAQAFNLLARKAGLTSLMATGTVAGNLNHAWNRVLIGGTWYEVDCTNDLFCSNFGQYAAAMGASYDIKSGTIVAQKTGDFYGA